MKKQLKILCIAVSLILLLMTATACKEPETDYEWYAYAMKQTMQAKQLNLTLEVITEENNATLLVLIDLTTKLAFAEISYTDFFSQVWYINGIRYLNQETKQKESTKEFLPSQFYKISETVLHRDI